MVSNTKMTWNRREAKTTKLGRDNKKARAKAGTPKFPIHVEKTAATKEQQASEIREENGDETVAEVLEKDAETTREVGKLRAGQLEKQAEQVRDKKEDLPEARP